MAKTWRNDVEAASGRITGALNCNSSWIDLLMAEQQLIEAKEAISSALTRLNATKTVTEAKKHVRIRKEADRG